jgi:hypothetical protein
MTCAVFIVHGFWLSQKNWVRIIFALAYALGFLAFNFGPAQVLVFNKGFIFTAKIIYFILGIGSFISGVLFFKDWVLLVRGVPIVSNATAGSRKKLSNLSGGWMAVLLITAALGAALAALATLWPINNYMMVLGNTAFLKGQWQTVILLLTGYILAGMWPLWFVWVFLSIKDLQPSLLKIFYASVFFTASSCVIFLFK